MADKAEKKQSGKKPNFFVRAGRGIAKFFRDCKAEVKKIVWPTPKSVFKNTGVVLVTIIVIGLFIFGLDTLLMLSLIHIYLSRSDFILSMFLGRAYSTSSCRRVSESILTY